MAKEPVEKAETAVAEEAPKTVPLEQFNNLYEQAKDLEARYKRLSELYNLLLEQYLKVK